MRLSDWQERFIKERQYLHNVSPKTISWYKQAFKVFAPVLSQDFASTAELKAALVQRIAELRPTNQAISVNTRLRVLNALFNWLHKEGVWERFRMPRLKEESKVIETLKPEHIKRILEFAPKDFQNRRTHTLLCTLLDTGMRIAEALTLQRPDIDFDNMLIKLKGKGSKERLVPMSFELRKLLYKFLGRHQSRFVFPTRSGERLDQNNVRKGLRRIRERLMITGVRFSPHTMRHSFAVGYLRNGGDLYTLSRILGHTSVTTTQLYLRSIGPDELRDAHTKFSILNKVH